MVNGNVVLDDNFIRNLYHNTTDSNPNSIAKGSLTSCSFVQLAIGLFLLIFNCSVVVATITTLVGIRLFIRNEVYGSLTLGIYPFIH